MAEEDRKPEHVLTDLHLLQRTPFTRKRHALTLAIDLHLSQTWNWLSTSLVVFPAIFAPDNSILLLPI